MDRWIRRPIDIVCPATATESAEEREARLQQVRSAQDRRIATESAEEREARLQQVRSAQDRRIATESAEEREARL